jgi:hypothetical protein
MTTFAVGRTSVAPERGVTDVTVGGGAVVVVVAGRVVVVPAKVGGRE